MNTLTWPEDAWIPVRKGRRYCSPACGHGCTYAQYERAKLDAARLAFRLGSGWAPVVNENLGWYYRVEHESGYAEVSPLGFGSDGYHAVVKDRPGALGGSWVGWGKTPQEALRAARELLREEHARITAARETLDTILKD